jgi:hypothetical protein
MNEISTEHDISRPLVIMNDYDKAFKRAARALYDDAKHQICVWHILKIVAHNIRRLWIGTLNGAIIGGQQGGVGSDGSRDDNETVCLGFADRKKAVRLRAVRFGQ